jgi:acyl dehydratase
LAPITSAAASGNVRTWHLTGTRQAALPRLITRSLLGGSGRAARRAASEAGGAQQAQHGLGELIDGGLVDALRVPLELGVSDWLEVTQETINRFADLTPDDQWIHLDIERAKQTPLGGTIAHGYFVLSLAPRFSYDMFTFGGFGFGLNYGLNRVRVPPPVPVGGRVRMRAKLAAVEEIPGGAQITTELTFEREGGDKPVCAAESMARVYLS